MISINKKEISENSQNNDSEVVLSVKGVSKKFCRDLKRSLLYGVQDIASEVLGLREKSDNLRSREFWALDNISFELRRGESIGLVGKNGSGKSTLLRVIAGLIKPDTGSVEINGRVAPLIALGAGFNPILTGRENIYANMSILGLSKKEINEKFDTVIEFAEIGDAIDSPVQTYSSGMGARLGFSCAIHTEPDILLIDEVLAVGDILFRLKCYRKLSELLDKGTTFVLVAHNPNSILSICESAIYLQKGKLIAEGNAASVMRKYDEDLFLSENNKSFGNVSFEEKPEGQSTGLDITQLYFRDGEGNIIDTPLSGKPVFLCVKFKSQITVPNAIVSILIKDPFREKENILNIDSNFDQVNLEILPETGEIQLQMPYCGIKPGNYGCRVWIKRKPNYIYDHASFDFQIKSTELMTQCEFYQPRKWKILNNVK